MLGNVRPIGRGASVGCDAVMWHGDWSGADWLLMGFGMLLFWALVVAGIVWLVRNSGSDRRADDAGGVDPGRPADRPGPTAQEILDERYARGEIGDDEYRTRRDTLSAR
jgi:putative membrane protein